MHQTHAKFAVENVEDNIEVNGDVTKLLKEIHRASHQMKNNTSIYDDIDKAKIKYYEYSQGEDESNVAHLIFFKNIVNIIEHPAGDIFVDAGLMKYKKEKDKNEGITGVAKEIYKQRARDKMMAVRLIKRGN